GARTHTGGTALRAADHRSRPAPVWRGGDRRARSRRPTPPPARAGVRPRALARSRPGARGPGSRQGGRPPRGARLKPVSHLDELDEFEAELELRLKKEYT